jgi:hypothetical protein
MAATAASDSNSIGARHNKGFNTVSRNKDLSRTKHHQIFDIAGDVSQWLVDQLDSVLTYLEARS